MIKRKRRRKINRKPEPRIKVVPSASIEDRIAREAAKAGVVIRNTTAANLLDSSYLVSAVYYHDGIFDNFNENKTDADPADRIVAQVIRQLPPRFKPVFIGLLNQRCACQSSELSTGRLVIPVPYEPLGHSRAAHPFAIDLFVPEGTPVRSASHGLVVLAENGWQPHAWFSTCTVRGGNTVIVFDPDHQRFFRYAHLEQAQATPGLFVEAGDILGYVGHTGFNANRKGHGRHLHFEINEFASGIVTAVPNEELEALLESASAACPQCALSISPQTVPE